MTQEPYLINIALPTPGPGLGIVYDVPSSIGLCRVNSVSCTFAAAILPSSRAVLLQLVDAQGTLKWRVDALVTHASGINRKYMYGQTGSPYIAASLDNEHLPLTNGYLIGGDRLTINARNIELTDQFTGGLMWLEMLGATSRPDYPPGANVSLPRGR